MLRAIGVALLWIVSFPLAILYHLLRKPKAKTVRVGSRQHARIVASTEARMAAARERGRAEALARIAAR